MLDRTDKIIITTSVSLILLFVLCFWYSAERQAKLYRQLYGIDVSASDVFWASNAIKEIGLRKRSDQ